MKIPGHGTWGVRRHVEGWSWGGGGEEGIEGVDLGCGLRRVGVRVETRNKVLKPNCYIVYSGPLLVNI